MRIDRLELRNFKRFAQAAFEFPRAANRSGNGGSFHVLVGENRVGKTSVLDALAVALGVWLENVPDSSLASSRRRLTSDKKRLTAIMEGDRTLLQQAPGELSVYATGKILECDGISWGQVLGEGAKKVSNRHSRQALDLIRSAYERIYNHERVLLPVIAYYGAGRTWLPHNQRQQVKARSNGPAKRWDAFYDCLNDRIRLTDLNAWFRTEAIERGNREGRYRPGFHVVHNAVLAAVPGADGLYYDGDLEQIVLSVGGNAQPFANLSAGERTLLAMVADIAIKMVTQNNFLVPPNERTANDTPLSRVLAQTPGVVLIDELDVHLHPKWQRRVVADLKRIFPEVQFVATTHSPQVIGELQPDEVCLLRATGDSETPAQSYGMDSNWILQVLMEAEEQDATVSTVPVRR